MKNLKRFRKRAGLTVFELAAETGVQPAIISRLENGQNASALYPTVIRLARALGVRADQLHDPVPRRPRKRRRPPVVEAPRLQVVAPPE